MYIVQIHKTLHEWWRYLIGVAVVFVGIIIFSMPHLMALGVKVAQGTLEASQLEDMNAIMTAFSPNVNLIFVILPFMGGLLFLLFWAVKVHKQSIRLLTTARPKVDWSRIFFAFFFWGIVSSALVLIDYAVTPEDYLLNFNWQPFVILCLIAFLLLPFQTSFEEYLFRGYLMQGIGSISSNKKFPLALGLVTIALIIQLLANYFYSIDLIGNLVIAILLALAIYMIQDAKFINNLVERHKDGNAFRIFNRKTTPLIITSVIFGLLHIANPEVEKLGYGIMVYYIATGLFLGILTLMDDGMELALGFHAANNIFTALLVTADWTALQTDSVFKDISDPALGFVELIAPVFIMYPLLLFIFAKKYKWTDWKDKLMGRIHMPKNDINPDYSILGEAKDLD